MKNFIRYQTLIIPGEFDVLTENKKFHHVAIINLQLSKRNS